MIAIIPPSSKLGKRRYEPDSDPAFDSENVDPSLFNKKSKNSEGDFTKATNFTLKPTMTGPIMTPTTRQTITPKRLAKKVTEIKPVSFSAPATTTTAPAGRSPTRKRIGILSKRRTSGSSFTRVDPPAFNLGRSSTAGLPFSIDSALSGTVPGRSTPKPAKAAAPVDTVMGLEDSMPSTWVFDIHEDTPDEELGNLMQHSAQTLDLSDDEERKARRLAEVGKENIAPPEYTGRQRAISRRDMMSDDPRTPLGDLKPSDYYADGCDANSYIIVDGAKDVKIATNVEKPAVSRPSPTEAGSANQDMWRELLASVDTTAAKAATTAAVEPAPETPHEKIDIWESESAHGDNEPEPQEPVTTTTSLEDSLAAASAHEEAAIEAAT